MRRARRGLGWPPIIPPLSARTTLFIPPSALSSHTNPVSNTVSTDPLDHHNRPRATVVSRSVRLANVNSPISAESCMAPFVSADLFQRVKAKYTEKFAANIQLSDIVSHNLISSILEVIFS